MKFIFLGNYIKKDIYHHLRFLLHDLENMSIVDENFGIFNYKLNFVNAATCDKFGDAIASYKPLKNKNSKLLANRNFRNHKIHKLAAKEQRGDVFSLSENSIRILNDNKLSQ